MKKKTSHFCLGIIFMIIVVGCNNKSNMIPPKPLEIFTSKLKVNYLWNKDIGNGNNGNMDIMLSPSLYKDIIYTTSFNGDINAVSIQNGSVIWSRNVQIKLSSTPLVNEKFVIAGNIYGELIALNRRSGNIAWKVYLPSSLFSKPTLYNNVIYNQTHDGSVTAHALKTGQVLWTQKLPTPDLMLIGNSSPIIYRNLVFVSNALGSLYGFRLESGQKQWDNLAMLNERNLETIKIVKNFSTPLIDCSTLYVTTLQGYLISLDTISGKINWQIKASILNNLDSNYDKLFASTETGQIIAYSKKIGSICWKQNILEGRHPSAPLHIDGYIVVGDYQSYVHIFNAQTGEYLNRIKIGGDSIRTQSIAIDKKFFIQTNNGKLAALEL